MQPSTDDLIGEVAKAVRPLVAKIEASVPTTKNHYGDYITVLSRIGEKVGAKNSSVYLGFGLALQRAGANKEGVLAALRVMGHLP